MSRSLKKGPYVSSSLLKKLNLVISNNQLEYNYNLIY